MGLLSGRWLLGRAGATHVALLGRSGRVAGAASQAAFAAIATSAGCISARMLDASMLEGTSDLMGPLSQATGELVPSKPVSRLCSWISVVPFGLQYLQTCTTAVNGMIF